MPSDQIDGAVVRPRRKYKKTLEVKVKDRKSSGTFELDRLNMARAYNLHTLIQR